MSSGPIGLNCVFKNLTVWFKQNRVWSEPNQMWFKQNQIAGVRGERGGADHPAFQALLARNRAPRGRPDTAGPGA